MSEIYDNWARLVRSTLRREQLRLIALRTPSLSPSPSSSWSRSSPSTTSSSPPSLNKIPTLLIGEAFDYRQILLATNYFSDSNFIKRGRSGELYYGVLHDGTRVVIKKMDYSSPYCVSELQVFGIGKDSHTSLVPLLGYCSDGFLVYKHMSRGDLLSLILKSQTDPYDEKSGSLSLDWISKLKIAVGTAEALCYLHDECSPPLVHRDIKARSIFVDDNYEVRLGSLGDVCALVEGHEHEEEEEKKAKKQNNTVRFQRPPRVPGKISSLQGITQKKKRIICTRNLW